MFSAQSLSAAAILAVLAGLTCTPARAGIVEHIQLDADPAEYEGPCPARVKLDAKVTIALRIGRELKTMYRWESNDGVRSDDVETMLPARIAHVQTEWVVGRDPGTTLTQSIKLHLFAGYKNGKTVADDYSSPVTIKVTCR